MRFFRLCVFIACVLSAALCFAQKEDWLPITPQDLQYNKVPGNSNAPAVRLYYAHYIDDNTHSEFIYERIKILTEKGKAPVDGYADARIRIFSDPDFEVECVMTDLKARTIHPDGSIVEFTGKPFEKLIVKGRGLKEAVKTFSFPDVTVGSIVEYKYRLTFRQPWFAVYLGIIFSTEEWVAQSDLFTVKEHLTFKPYTGGVATSTTQVSLNNDWDGAQISSVSSNLGKEKPKSKGNETELELANVPAFEPEDDMPPEDNYKPKVEFFYARRGAPTQIDKAWLDLGKTLYDRYDDFLAKDSGIKDAATKAIGSESEPGLKLRRLYERAQQVRNLTFEPPLLEEEMKKQKIQRPLGVGDVLSHGYGTSRDITLLFIAMARAAGFDASVVRASDRSRSFFNKDYTSEFQLSGMFAAVNLNGQEIYLEPGTKFCPYGTLPWKHTAIESLKLDKKGGTFIKTNPAGYDKSVIQRNGDVTISEDGTLKGDLVVEYKGYEAFERRLDTVLDDEAGKKKYLEDEVKEWLPKGSVAKQSMVQGWDATDDPLVARFNIEVPNYATGAGKRFLVPAYLFQAGTHKNGFKSSDRKYPVYFPYPFGESDVISMRIPAGFTIESVPDQQQAGLGYAKYINMTQSDGTQLITQRKLLFNGIFADTSKYSELKTFFNKVQAGDEQQAVLHGGTSAQKGN
jgi:uncharacterized protein DUF3857